MGKASSKGAPRKGAATPSADDMDDPLAAATPPADSNQALGLPLTVLVCLVPLGLLGELYRWLGRPLGGSGGQLLSDPLLGRLGAVTGITLPIIPVLLLIIGGLLAQAHGKRPWELPAARTVGLVVLWSLIWAGVRICLGITGHLLFNPHASGGDGQPGLALVGLAMSGAMQEELLFRCLVLGGMVEAGRVLEVPSAFIYAVALPISAAFFSLAHTEVVNHFPGAEPFAWPAFIERGLAGLLYGMVFVRQGLAVCTMAHTGYNLGLLFLPGRWLD